MIRQYEQEIEGPDDANIPVNLFFRRVKVKGAIKYRLSYDIFMPRKGMAEGGYIIADTKEELQEFIRKNILPSYQIALDAVTAIVNGSRDTLYYWDAVDPMDEESEDDLEEVDDPYNEEEEETT